MPAYLLLIDGLISQSPDNVALLSAGAQLFALYGSRFATARARRHADGEGAPLRRARDLSRARAGVPVGRAPTTTRFVAELEAVDEKDHRCALLVRRQLAEPPRRDERGLDGRRRAAVGRSGARARAGARRDLRGRRAARLPRDSELAAAAGARRQARRRARALRARHRAVGRPRSLDQGRIRAALRAPRVRPGAARPAVDGSAERPGRRAAA